RFLLPPLLQPPQAIGKRNRKVSSTEDFALGTSTRLPRSFGMKVIRHLLILPTLILVQPALAQDVRAQCDAIGQVNLALCQTTTNVLVDNEPSSAVVPMSSVP